jgi:hypothetical protein
MRTMMLYSDAELETLMADMESDLAERVLSELDLSPRPTAVAQPELVLREQPKSWPGSGP